MDRQFRVLAIHDVSCVGRCSLTAALPIISVSGAECCVIPTAVLSTQTGGFSDYTCRDLTDSIVPIVDHWMSLGIGFDAIYTGFLGSEEQIGIVRDTVSRLGSEKTLVIVDPAMADGGSMYPLFDMEYAKHMTDLCAVADVIVPNMTEAFFILGREYVLGPYSEEFIESMLKDLSRRCRGKVILTGVSFSEGKVGAGTYDASTGRISYCLRDAIPGFYHGTGDVFASALTAALVNGRDLEEAAEIAVDFTVGSIMRTYRAGTDVRFGVNFEAGLADLSRSIGKKVRIEQVSDGGLGAIASEAADIFREYYPAILPEGQAEYMADTLLTEDAFRQSVSEKGYRYCRMVCGEEDIGFTALCPEGNRMFISKLYLKKEFRGKGLGTAALKAIFRICTKEGFVSAYLTVNKGNTPAIRAYERNGFKKVRAITTDIGNGYVMDDYIMEKVF